MSVDSSRRRVFCVDRNLELDTFGEGSVEELLKGDEAELVALQVKSFTGRLAVKATDTSKSTRNNIGEVSGVPRNDDASKHESDRPQATSSEAQSQTRISDSSFSPISESLKQKIKDAGNFLRAPEKQSDHSSWAKTLDALQFLGRAMPPSVREKRASSRREAMLDQNGQVVSGSATVPTRLHQLCASKDATFNELYDQLRQDPSAANVQDSNGRFPLHILGDNDTLVSTQSGKDTATKFASLLIAANPDALTTPDDGGFFPFVSLINDWSLWQYESASSKPRKKTLMSRMAGAVGVPSSTTELACSAEATPQSLMSERSETLLEQSILKNFPEVEMWDEVAWCFDMLSLVMDELGGLNGGLYKSDSRQHPNQKDKLARNVIASHILDHMPTIVKTLLLIEDEGGKTRKKLLESSLILRILLSPQSVGPWVTLMLQRKGIPAERAIDYLALISETTPEDYAGSYRPLVPEDIFAFRREKERVFLVVDQLNGTIASLVVLPQAETDRASTTEVVWFVMTRNLERPFVVSLVLIDLVSHVTLMMAYRNDVSVEDPGARDIFGVVPSSVVYVICAQYLIRKACEAMSLLILSRTVMISYLSNLWTLLDLTAIILTCVTVSINSTNIGLNAFVLGLLWLKILGFLKTTNKDMSLFISALFQILKALRFFLVVMFVFIGMFADMMHIAVSTKDNGQFCADLKASGELEGPVGDFCSPNVIWSYLRFYTMLIGDFQLDDLTETDGMIILFVLFSLLGIIILLNMLIAVVSDSYQDAKETSLYLFGRSRVLFVAQNQAVESLLKPGTIPIQGWFSNKSARNAFNIAGRLLCWLVLLSLGAASLMIFVYMVGRINEVLNTDSIGLAPIIIMMCMAVILAFALWVFFLFAIGNAIRNWCCGIKTGRCFDGITYITDRAVKAVARRLFGLDHEIEQSWAGAVDNLLIDENSSKETRNN